jgi:hypothetical protein
MKVLDSIIKWFRNVKNTTQDLSKRDQDVYISGLDICFVGPIVDLYYGKAFYVSYSNGLTFMIGYKEVMANPIDTQTLRLIRQLFINNMGHSYFYFRAPNEFIMQKVKENE